MKSNADLLGCHFMNSRLLLNFAAASVLGIFSLHFQHAQAGILTITPYASVSSTKSIKPNKVGKSANGSGTETESVTQKTTYGLNLDFRISQYFVFRVGGGTNQTDATRKMIAMRDEYGYINYEKDANVDPAKQDATYRKIEKQNMGRAELLFQPILTNYLWLKFGAGVRAMRRDVAVTDVEKNIKTSIKDPFRYHAVGTAGAGARLLRGLSANVEYKFYFIKFPKTQPHEQEVLIGFGIQI